MDTSAPFEDPADALSADDGTATESESSDDGGEGGGVRLPASKQPRQSQPGLARPPESFAASLRAQHQSAAPAAAATSAAGSATPAISRAPAPAAAVAVSRRRGQGLPMSSRTAAAAAPDPAVPAPPGHPAPGAAPPPPPPRGYASRPPMTAAAAMYSGAQAPPVPFRLGAPHSQGQPLQYGWPHTAAHAGAGAGAAAAAADHHHPHAHAIAMAAAHAQAQAHAQAVAAATSGAGAVTPAGTPAAAGAKKGGKRKRTPKAAEAAKKSGKKRGGGKKGKGASSSVGIGAELTPQELAGFLSGPPTAGTTGGKVTGKKAAAQAKKGGKGSKATKGGAPPGSAAAAASTDAEKESRRDQEAQPQQPHPSPEKPPEPKKPAVTMWDRRPRRVVNPLLEMPRYPPPVSGPGPGIPPELIPNGGEFWNALELYHPEPDTFPVSYYARLLGYDVPAAAKPGDEDDENDYYEVDQGKDEGEGEDEEGGEEEKKEGKDEADGKDETIKKEKKKRRRRKCPDSLAFDPKTVPPLERDDPFLFVPEPGTFSDVVLRHQRGRRRRRRNVPLAQESRSDDVDDAETDSDGDGVLDYVDPVWRTILSEFRGYDGGVMTSASLPGAGARPVSEDCVAFARERGVLAGPSPKPSKTEKRSDEAKGAQGGGVGKGGRGDIGTTLKFRFATMEDVPALGLLNASKRRFETLADIATSLKSPGQYFLLAEEEEDEKVNRGGKKDDNDNGDNHDGESSLPSTRRRPVGFVHYGFCWYKLGELTQRKREKERERESRENASWARPGPGGSSAVASASANIRTPTVSELVLYIDDIQCAGRPPSGGEKDADVKAAETTSGEAKATATATGQDDKSGDDEGGMDQSAAGASPDVKRKAKLSEGEATETSDAQKGGASGEPLEGKDGSGAQEDDTQRMKDGSSIPKAVSSADGSPGENAKDPNEASEVADSIEETPGAGAVGVKDAECKGKPAGVTDVEPAPASSGYEPAATAAGGSEQGTGKAASAAKEGSEVAAQTEKEATPPSEMGGDEENKSDGKGSADGSGDAELIEETKSKVDGSKDTGTEATGSEEQETPSATSSSDDAKVETGNVSGTIVATGAMGAAAKSTDEKCSESEAVADKVAGATITSEGSTVKERKTSSTESSPGKESADADPSKGEHIEDKAESTPKNALHQRDGEPLPMEPATSLEDSPAALVLTALVLEHARSSDVLYGMLEVPRTARAFFSRFYRMKTLPLPPPSMAAKPAVAKHDEAGTPETEEEGGEKSEGRTKKEKVKEESIPMACDLLKCNYRYAFLRKVEEEERKKKQGAPNDSIESAGDAAIKERMLVRMPTAREAARSQNADNESKAGEGAIVTFSRAPPKPESRFFSNAKAESRSKVAGVRVRRGLNTSSESNAGVLSLTDSLAKGGREGKPLEVPSTSADSCWKVMRCFSLPSEPPAAEKKPKRGGFYADIASAEQLEADAEGDRVAAELVSKQKELLALESSFDPKLRSLLESVYSERLCFESPESLELRQALEEDDRAFGVVLDRRREADIAWQAQLEQDMDAVCDVCADGEVTVDNQILFCEACNVAVHQKCYGIDRVPEGDYFCRPCRYFKRDTTMAPRHYEGGAVPLRVAPSPLPIFCELCPRRQGAFVQMFNPHSGGRKRKVQPKWAHVVCAKWHGVRYTEGKVFEEVEDVTPMKQGFFAKGNKCCLCDGNRGMMVDCRREGCNKWLHVTCARSSGICEVVPGQNHKGVLQVENPWTLCCPEHSHVNPEDQPELMLSIEQLRAAAQTFPPEEPPPKDFNKMNAKERKRFLENPEYEEDFLEKITKRREGARCSVCGEYDAEHESSGKNRLLRCSSCEAFFHPGCYSLKLDPDAKGNVLCEACRYTADYADMDNFEEPYCHMCNMSKGTLKKAHAMPQSKKRWSNNPSAFKKSLFGKQIWCHASCGLWHPRCYFKDEDTGYNCSDIIMADGHSHVDSNKRCGLCGMFDKIKLPCSQKSCYTCGKKQVPFYFHISCARQAGLQVNEKDMKFLVHCFYHSRCEDVLRARMEDMIEFERIRTGNNLVNSDKPMTYPDVAKIFHFGVPVLCCLGWAWRWADWWVLYGDNWEPLLEDGQDETTMTDEELKKVPSTPESRCVDARRCRLSAFGAALRNRDYDNVPGDDQVALDNAIRAVLHTKSLVGPLTHKEIDFFAEWLGRVYRSNYPLLGFGADKIPIDPDACKHRDNSPKHELGLRPLPGKQTLAKSSVFETGVTEVDDYLSEFVLPEVPKKVKKKPDNVYDIPKKGPSISRVSESKRQSRRRKRSHSIDEEVAASLDDEEPLANICEKKRKLERLAADKEKEAKAEKKEAKAEKKKEKKKEAKVEKKKEAKADRQSSENHGRKNQHITSLDALGISSESDIVQSLQSDEPPLKRQLVRRRGKQKGKYQGKSVSSAIAEPPALPKNMAVEKNLEGEIKMCNAEQKKDGPPKQTKNCQQKISDVFRCKPSEEMAPPRKRGRPRRQETTEQGATSVDDAPVRRRPGRPKRSLAQKKTDLSSATSEDRIPRKTRLRRGREPSSVGTASTGKEKEQQLSIREELGRK